MIGIIGAGPVGSYTAYLLARKGEKVKVFEEHKLVGRPVQCTGITTDAIDRVIKVDQSIIVNKVNTSRVHSPNGDYVDVRMRKPDYIFDRAMLDIHIADLARSENVELLHNKRFVKFKQTRENVEVCFSDGSKEIVDYLIGADGVNSSVAKAMGHENRKFLYGTQARVEMKISDKGLFETYLGIGDFAWVVPENERIARVGIIGDRGSAKNFLSFIDSRKGRVLEYQGGLVPFYDPNLKLKKGRVMLIGDAATQVKPTTYGGIVPGMLAARELVKGIERYEVNFRKTVGKELNIGLMMRKMLKKFDEEDYNELIRLCKQSRVLSVLNNTNRDYPKKMLLKLLLREPRFLKYAINGLFV